MTHKNSPAGVLGKIKSRTCLHNNKIPGRRSTRWFFAAVMLSVILLLGACQARTTPPEGPLPSPIANESGGGSVALAASDPSLTPVPTRPAYAPGELVPYTVQTGDTLPALAAHFNTTVGELMEANPIIPDSVTTLPPGLPMEIPIYFKPFWGSAYQIIPDSLFVNGPEQIGFETQEFTNAYPGWLNGYLAYAAGANRTGAQIVDYVAQNFSVSPQLLLALLEHQAGALSQSAPTAETINYPLGNVDRSHRGLYLQLVWAANTLNDYFYQWRQGTLQEFDLQDGRVQRPDPWQNAATVSLHAYFNQLYSPDVYEQAISPAGLAATYLALFGDPWLAAQPHIPGSLEQPPFSLPFEPGKIWALSGGPHTAWGEGEPLAALDFAPPAVAGGCLSSPEWATAVAPGVVVRSEPGTVTLDLDGDGDERTGWVVFYFHMATEDRVPVGTSLQTGDFIGHPSCEGGRATGTHIHIARKYNGEWIPADGPLAFNLAGWLAHAGDQRYQGTLTLNERTIIACVGCANQASLISAEKP